MKNIIALGFFDGVHIGHRQILDKTVEVARKKGLVPCALTYENHPRAVVFGCAPPALSSLSARVAEIERCGVKKVFVLPFTAELANTEACGFAAMLREKYDCAAVVYGENFAFGKGGAARGAEAELIWKELGIDAYVVPPVIVNAQTVSSTLVRKCVDMGDMERAHMLLGRPWRAMGTVVKGEQKGRQIGFPTLNIIPEDGFSTPPNGVYVSLVHCPDGVVRRAVTNVGVRPTFYSDSKVYIESHILNYTGVLYGHHICVDFLKQIRKERKFQSTDELKAAIAEDVKSAQQYELK